MGFRELKRSLLDAGDVLKHASGRALLRAAKERAPQLLNVVEGERASARSLGVPLGDGNATRSVMEDPTFFSRVAYRVGRHDYTLDEIENGVLRRNAPHPVSGKPLLQQDDPRCDASPSFVDPRIHTALVCASASCPGVRFYEPDALDSQLDAASRAFVNSETEVDNRGRRIVLPLVFRYYESDFGGEADVREFVGRYADEHLARRLARSSGFTLDYARHDWALNQS